MTLATLGARAAEWAATYAIHSTVLLGTVAILTLRLRSDAWREVLWRGALLGAVATTTLAIALPLDPLAGRWRMPGIESPAGLVRTAPPAGAGVVARGSSLEVGGPGAGSPAGRAVAEGSTPFGAWVLLVWAAIAALLLALLAARNLRVMRRLRGRARVESGPLVAMLAELRRLGGVWSPVRLSVSPAAPTPLVIGASEICLPPRFLDGLAEDRQRAALAHELAHVARKDPWWQLATAVLHALLFFQPLQWLARRRLRDAAENLCDDWAVRRTGSPLALGRCLADIASWVSADPLPHLGSTHAMAEGGSPLLERVRRIASGTAGGQAPKVAPLAVTAALLVATVALAPAVAGGRAEVGPAEPATITAPADVALLERLALEDPSPEVREEAASGLAESSDPAARVVLLRLARAAADPRVRSEAIQRLDESPDDEVVATVEAVAFDDPMAAVRLDAVDVLAGMRADNARAALRRIAADHPDGDLRRAAIQALAHE